MSEQRIVVEIGPDGSITAKTDGFKGETCMDALQEILGGSEVFRSVKPTDDFYQETKVAEIQKRKAGRD